MLLLPVTNIEQFFVAFKEALAQNKLKFSEKNYFEGNFTDFDAEASLRKVLKSKKDLSFDAIVCANDMMAIGCNRVFKDLEIDVPQDVKVVGFDDAQFAAYSNPRLSTINQNIYKQGYDSAQVAFDILSTAFCSSVISGTGFSIT